MNIINPAAVHIHPQALFQCLTLMATKENFDALDLLTPLVLLDLQSNSENCTLGPAPMTKMHAAQ